MIATTNGFVGSNRTTAVVVNGPSAANVLCNRHGFTEITNASACMAAARLIGWTNVNFMVNSLSEDPAGCWFEQESKGSGLQTVYFNEHSNAGATCVEAYPKKGCVCTYDGSATLVTSELQPAEACPQSGFTEITDAYTCAAAATMTGNTFFQIQNCEYCPTGCHVSGENYPTGYFVFFNVHVHPSRCDGVDNAGTVGCLCLGQDITDTVSRVDKPQGCYIDDNAVMFNTYDSEYACSTSNPCLCAMHQSLFIQSDSLCTDPLLSYRNINDADDCRSAAEELGIIAQIHFSVNPTTPVSSSSHPEGCYIDMDTLYYNTFKSGVDGDFTYLCYNNLLMKTFSCRPGQCGDNQCECPAGKYGITTCTDCEPGQYQDNPGRNTCKPCAKGSHNNVEGLTECYKCGAGKFQNTEGQSGCKGCSAGKYSNREGLIADTQCSNCVRGKFSEDAGEVSSTACKFCPDGTFQDEDGKATKAQCKPCPVGRAAGSLRLLESTKKRQLCDPCLNGRFQDETNQVSCKQCNAGKYADDTKAYSSCTDCEPGRYMEHGGATACKSCPGGWFRQAQPFTSCTECPQGWFDVMGLQCAPGVH